MEKTTEKLQTQLHLDLNAREELDAKQAREQYLELNEILGFKVPLDGLLTALQGRASIDVVAFDKKLDTPDGVSMNQYIMREYGKRAVQISTNLL